MNATSWLKRFLSVVHPVQMCFRRTIRRKKHKGIIEAESNCFVTPPKIRFLHITAQQHFLSHPRTRRFNALLQESCLYNMWPDECFKLYRYPKIQYSIIQLFSPSTTPPWAPSTTATWTTRTTTRAAAPGPCLSLPSGPTPGNDWFNLT